MSSNSLPYPVDMYLSIHNEIIAGVKQHLDNRTLLFNLSNDKYLCAVILRGKRRFFLWLQVVI